MLAFNIFSTIILLTITSVQANRHDQSRFVEYYSNDPYYEAVCQNNRTKGIYNPINPGSVEGHFKCCKGKLLVGPLSVFLDANAKSVLDAYFPDFTNCDYNVTIENDNDDFATLMWKTHACKMKSILGKAEKEIDFKAYVEFRTINYTKDHNGINLQKIISDENNGKGCPEGDKETAFLKKLEKYFWCFYRNEEKICENSTAEAKVILARKLNLTRLANNRTKISCPLVPPGTRLTDHCCNGISTPSSWFLRSSTMMNVDSPYNTLPNGTVVVQKSYLDCLRTSRNFTTTKQGGIIFRSRYRACLLNPVTFSADGSSKPEIKLEFSSDRYLSLFNTAAKTAIRKRVLQIKKETKISTNLEDFRKRSGIKFEDADEALKKLTSPMEKAILYFAYYNALNDVMRSSSLAVCHA